MDPPPPYSSEQKIGFNPPAQQGFAPPPQEYPPPQQGYAPPQPGYAPPQPSQPTVMVMPPQIVSFGPVSHRLVCPYCHQQISSRVETEPSTKTHLFALLLCLFGCIPCCLIPYCTDSCQNQNHYCPSCSAYLGAYSN